MSQKNTAIADHTLTGLKEAREAIGVSQLALANQLGEPRATIVRLENGELVKQSTVYKIYGKFVDHFGDKFVHIKPINDPENDKKIIIDYETKSIHSSKRPWRDLSNSIMECYVEMASKNDKDIFELIEKLELILKIPHSFKTLPDLKGESFNQDDTV